MSITRRRLALLALAACLSLPAFAEDRATPDEARALLAKAIVHLKSVGQEKAMADFMTKPSPWVDRDLYITVFDMSGKTLAHGANPRLVGKDNINLQDANGKFHIKERVEIAKSKGKGEQQIAVFNPVSKQIETKLVYFEKVDGVIVGCGSYKPA